MNIYWCGVFVCVSVCMPVPTSVSCPKKSSYQSFFLWPVALLSLYYSIFSPLGLGLLGTIFSFTDEETEAQGGQMTYLPRVKSFETEPDWASGVLQCQANDIPVSSSPLLLLAMLRPAPLHQAPLGRLNLTWTYFILFQ